MFLSDVAKDFPDSGKAREHKSEPKLLLKEIQSSSSLSPVSIHLLRFVLSVHQFKASLCCNIMGGMTQMPNDEGGVILFLNSVMPTLYSASEQEPLASTLRFVASGLRSRDKYRIE